MNDCYSFLKELSLVGKAEGRGFFGPPMVMITSFLIHRITHIWTMQNKNGCLPGSTDFEIELHFLSNGI
jgi:hypothetical protein